MLGRLPSIQEAMSSVPNTIDTLDGGTGLGSLHYTLGLYLLNSVIFVCVSYTFIGCHLDKVISQACKDRTAHASWWPQYGKARN